MNLEEAKAMREQLVEVYNSYIDEMARDVIDNKKTNPILLENTNKVMNQINNYDIIIAVEKQKENMNNIEKTM